MFFAFFAFFVFLRILTKEMLLGKEIAFGRVERELGEISRERGRWEVGRPQWGWWGLYSVGFPEQISRYLFGDKYLDIFARDFLVKLSSSTR